MAKLERKHTKPPQSLPEHAADCHMHVFGPFERFPLAAERAYNVGEALVAAHEAMKRRVGLERTVLVQASGYGNDNRAMLAALAELGPRGRGVAVFDPELPNKDLIALDAAGVRGARLNFYTLSGRYAGDRAQWIERYARVLAPLGWHLQVLLDGSGLAALERDLARAQVPMVVDHMGLPDAREGVKQPGFQVLLRLVARGNVWVKVSGADRITRHSGHVRDAIPFIQALAAAAPERLVWGSDWPNIGFHSREQVKDGELLQHRELDAGEMLKVLAKAVPDAGVLRRILSLNPAELYGFPA
jgi:predicted TIM-barrel fold metal-dependent hydrolase